MILDSLVSASTATMCHDPSGQVRDIASEKKKEKTKSRSTTLFRVSIQFSAAQRSALAMKESGTNAMLNAFYIYKPAIQLPLSKTLIAKICGSSMYFTYSPWVLQRQGLLL